MEAAGGVAFYDTGAGGELAASTELQRNPPLPQQRGGPIQATLAMRINGTTPCDTVYISQAAVDAHRLHTPAGWYFEIPDADVPFSLAYTVLADSYPLGATIQVDGQKAVSWTTNTFHEVEVPGVSLGTNATGQRLIQPFLLRRATFHEGRGENNEEADSEAGIIALELARLQRLSASILGSLGSTALQSGFVQQALSEKKESFGIDHSVAVGPTIPLGRGGYSKYGLAEAIGKLEVRYRTAKFFDNLQHQIASSSEVAESQAVQGGDDRETEDEDEADRERAKKRIKSEPHTTDLMALKSTDSIDPFLLHLGRKEGLEMPKFKPLLVELDKRSLTTVGQLSELTLEQWYEIMRDAELGASMARSARQLASSCLNVCLSPEGTAFIILD